MLVAHSRMARLDLLRDPLGRPSGFPDWPGRNGIVVGMLFSGRVIESSVAQDLAYAKHK